MRNRNYDNKQENLDHNRYANYRQFLDQNRQRKMGNQQLSRTNQKYPQKSEVICNYCKKPGHIITNCIIRLNKQQSEHSENSNVLPSTDALREA